MPARISTRHPFHRSVKRLIFAVALLVVIGLRTAPAGTLTVESTRFAGTPDILAFNLAHFYPGSNTKEWWRYSGAHGSAHVHQPGRN